MSTVPAAQKKVYTGIMGTPTRVFDWIVEFMAQFANILMAFIVILITVEVVARYFFQTGILFASEITEQMMMWMTFLATTWVLRKEGHVIVDLVPMRLTPRHRAMLYTVLSIIGIFACFAYTWYAFTTTIDLFQRQRALSTLLRPQAWIIYAVMPAGFLAVTIQFCRRTNKFFQEYRALGKKQEVVQEAGETKNIY
jgi:TRAP-type C4-dicarboxylate transport system permease small subunit